MSYDATATHRVQRATFTILIIGAFAGSILGAGLLGIVGLIADGPGGYLYVWDAFTLAAFVGGVLGGLSLPFVASTILSHVAIGRILIYGAAGTVVGTLGASTVSPFDSILSTLGAVVGFLAGIMLLKRLAKQ